MCLPPCGYKPPLWCCRKRQPPCDPVEMTGTGEDPVLRRAAPWRLWTTPPGASPTVLKRSDDRDGHPTPRLRRLTRSVGRETPGRETLLETDEEGGATTGGRGDTLPTQTLELRDPDDPKIDVGRAGGTSSSVCHQELGEPAKKGRPAARAIKLAGGEAEDRNSSAVDWSLEMSSCDGEALKDVVSMTTPRY